jgi:hypothetical protein
VVILTANSEDAVFLDVITGRQLLVLRGGFDKMFRAVVTQGMYHNNRHIYTHVYTFIENYYIYI